MKKIIVVFTVLVLFAGICGATGQSEKTGASSVVTLSVSHPWFGGDAHAPFMEWALADFQEKFPNIKLDIYQIPQQEIRQKTRADFMAGVAADIILWYGGAEANDFISEDLLSDLSYLIQPMKGNFINGSLENVTFEGKTYGLPLCQNFFAFYLNTDIYKEYGFEYPKTYGQLLNQVRAFKKGGLIPIMVPGKNHELIQHFYSFVANMTTGKDDFNDAAHKQGGVDYFKDGFVKAAEIIKELHDNGAFDPNIDGIPMASVEEMFARGEGAMYFAGIWRVGALPREIRDKMQPILFPVVEGYSDDPAISTSQTEMAWFANSSVDKSEAKKKAVETFIRYFADPDISQMHAELTDTIVPIQKGVDLGGASLAVLGSQELVASSELRPFMLYFQTPAQGSATSEMTWNLINGRGSVRDNISKLNKIPANTN